MPHFGQVDGQWTKVLLDLLIWQPPSRDAKIPQRNTANILYGKVHGLFYGWFVLLKVWSTTVNLVSEQPAIAVLVTFQCLHLSFCCCCPHLATPITHMILIKDIKWGGIIKHGYVRKLSPLSDWLLELRWNDFIGEVKLHPIVGQLWDDRVVCWEHGLVMIRLFISIDV
jgi:hypothetical protein